MHAAFANNRHTRVRRSALLVAALACVLGLGVARAAHAENLTDPCALLTQAQVSAIVGKAVGAAMPITENSCEWIAPRAPAARGAMVTIRLAKVSEFDAQHAATVGLSKGPLSGVGDDALYVALGNLVSLYVKKSATVFVLRIYGVDDPDTQKSMEKALALDVLGKL